MLLTSVSVKFHSTRRTLHEIINFFKLRGNMRFKPIIFSLILLAWIKCYSSVIIEEVNIESDFYGPLSKNTVEFIFYSTESSNQKGYLSFKLNSSAIITKFWLEIDGKLVEDETFRRDTGSKIYNEIVSQHIDPAILRKYDHLDKHTISVFPCILNEKKRVVVEYYSILETIDDELTWQFEIENTRYRINKDSTTINFKANTNLQSNTTIKSNNRILKNKDEKQITFSDENRLTIQFRFPYDSNFHSQNLRIHNDFYELNEISLQNADRKRKQLKYCPNVPAFIESFINDYKRTDYQIYEAVKSDTFLVKFLDYIKREFPEESTYDQIFSNWFIKNNSTFYIDSNLVMKATNTTTNINQHNEIKCPYLNIYFEYLDLLQQHYTKQMNSNYLTNHNVKVVLERNQKTDLIKNRIMSNEGKYRPKKFQTSKFGLYEDAPIIENKVQPNFTNSLLEYLDVEGECFMQIEVLKTGNIGAISIVKPLHPILDHLAIYAVKQWTISPAKSANMPVNAWLTVPVEFYKRKKNIQEIPLSNNSFYLFNKKFQENDDIIYDVKFSLKKSKSIELYSIDFFNLLMTNPDLVEICYRL